LFDVYRTVDAAVDACYRSKPFKAELERFEFLFELYRRCTESMIQALEPETKKKSKS
jgi:hypothetical protein